MSPVPSHHVRSFALQGLCIYFNSCRWGVHPCLEWCSSPLWLCPTVNRSSTCVQRKSSEETKLNFKSVSPSLFFGKFTCKVWNIQKTLGTTPVVVLQAPPGSVQSREREQHSRQISLNKQTRSRALLAGAPPLLPNLASYASEGCKARCVTNQDIASARFLHDLYMPTACHFFQGRAGASTPSVSP